MADATAALKVKTKAHPIEMFHQPVVTSAKQVYQGIMVGTDASGNLLAASDALCIQMLGWAQDTVLGDGTLTCKVMQGLGSAAADAGAPPTLANFGQICYVKDDQTVSMDPSVGIAAGQVYAIDAVTGAVYFLSGFGVPGVTGTSKKYFTVLLADMVAADASVYSFASPVKGKITKIQASLQGHALATADATITAKIGATGITGGVLTIDYDGVGGATVGDVTKVVPSALNAVVEGSNINFTIGGGNTNGAAQMALTVEITTTA